MKSLTPDTTLRRLGWTAARQSLKSVLTRTAPKPKFRRRHLFAYCKAWLRWIPQTFKLWLGLWKNRRTHGDYAKVEQQGIESREIFKQTKRRMHLTEDEIFEQGKKIFGGYTHGTDNVGELFSTSEVKIPSGKGLFPTLITPAQLDKLR